MIPVFLSFAVCTRGPGDWDGPCGGVRRQTARHFHLCIVCLNISEILKFVREDRFSKLEYYLGGERAVRSLDIPIIPRPKSLSSVLEANLRQMRYLPNQFCKNQAPISLLCHGYLW